MLHQVYSSPPYNSQEDVPQDPVTLKRGMRSSASAHDVLSSSTAELSSSSHSSHYPLAGTTCGLANQDEILSRLHAMRAQESEFYTFARYSLLPPSPLAQSGQLQDFTDEPTDAGCRIKMVDWQTAVIRHCSFSQECVAVAMANLDRYLSTPQGYKALVDRRQFQLACMTSIYLSIKIYEVESITPRGMAKVSRDDYTEDEIVKCEREMLSALDWHINPPTPQVFAELYVSLLQPNTNSRKVQYQQESQEQQQQYQVLQMHVMEYVRVQIDMVCREYHFVGAAASKIALAATLNGLSCTEAEGIVSSSVDFDLLTQELLEKLQFSQGDGFVPADIQTMREELILMFPSSSRDQDLSASNHEEDIDTSTDGKTTEQSLDTSIDDVTRIKNLSEPLTALSPRSVGKENSPLQNKHLFGQLLCGMFLPFGLLQDER